MVSCIGRYTFFIRVGNADILNQYRTSMSTTTKIQSNGQVTIPTHVRERAGLAKGDMVEFSYQRGKIVITPRTVIDHSQFPSADDE